MIYLVPNSKENLGADPGSCKNWPLKQLVAGGFSCQEADSSTMVPQGTFHGSNQPRSAWVSE